MKNLFSTLFKPILLVLLVFSYLVTLAYSPPAKGKSKTNAYTVKNAKNAHSKLAVDFGYNLVGLPEISYLSTDRYFTYLRPVNDPKPDNTNYQLVRELNLKIHRSHSRYC